MMITSFQNEYRFLSNFWRCDITQEDELGSITYPSAEHAYVAYKTLDLQQRRHIATIPNPKSYGRSQLELRPNWEKIKLNIMRNVVYAKFAQNPDLAEKLRATGDVQIIEGNTWGDRFWGQCPLGTGRNELGKILMEVRASKWLTSD